MFGRREAHTQAVVDMDGDGSGHTRTVDVHIFQNGGKGVAVDHIPLRQINELFGLLLMVIFSPEDLRIVKAGPIQRRIFMDMELCQLNPVYCHALRSYHHTLKQRNGLLKSLRGAADAKLEDTLPVWDEPLCKYGSQIMAMRAAFITEMDALARDTHREITGGRGGRLSLVYRPNVTAPEMFAEELRRNRTRDIQQGSTSAGIHRDDIRFDLDGNDARVFGSQGQQRTAALSVKLAEIELIKKHTRKVPVLLLDDVLSELDVHRQGFLLKYIGGLQTVLACTGVEDILKKASNIGETRLINVVKGEMHVV
jgi:DNA replication and repair protein RecF